MLVACRLAGLSALGTYYAEMGLCAIRADTAAAPPLDGLPPLSKASLNHGRSLECHEGPPAGCTMPDRHHA
jgi:hypothetical protein